ncbi:MAG: Gfo/Idh/MocA family oxidoreductase [Treponema sp.]|nr:Gfo/Idh/MocA family oxidoreductase [Treponema sp.]
MKKKINWGLVGTGGITNRFLIGLRAAEGAFAAAVASRTKENAEGFAARHGIEKSFDNFDRMLEDPAIDAVYIGTPHPTHCDLTIRALNAKKAVLCEKPAAINALELREMIRAARENNAFFMEAMWNRFSPPLVKVREWLNEGLIGEVKMVDANTGSAAAFNPKSRLFDPEQGGGALLDVGIYPLALGSLVFGGQKPERIVSQVFFNEAGSDSMTSAILSYGNGRSCHFTASFGFSMTNEAWIYGTGGKIHIPNYIFAHNAELSAEPRYNYRYEPEYISNGYNYEAEEVMDCIRDGRIESTVMPWDESLVLAEIMDTIRSQWNFKYPSEK